MIRFRVLGTVDLKDAAGHEHHEVLRRPKLLALLTYLAAARPLGFHRRDTLLALLWPELDQAHARNALRQAVHSLRGALGRDVLVARGEDELSLDPNRLSCDVADFDRYVDGGEPRSALGLYRGDLLAGFHVSDAPEFERWLDLERGHLRRRAVGAALALAGDEEARGGALRAARWVRRALEISPYDEGTLRRLLRLLDEAGDRAEAMQEYDAFVRRLQADLELDPAPETMSLSEAIRERSEPRGGASREFEVPSDAVRKDEFDHRTLERAVESGSPADGTSGAPAGIAAPGTGRRSVRSGFRLAVPALLLTVVSALVVARPRAPASLDPNLLAVAPFEVLHPELELWREGLVDVLARSLDGAGPFRTVTPTVVVRRWQGRVDRESARTLAYQTGAGFVLHGQVANAGPDSVRVRAAVLDARKGGTLAEIDRTDRSDRIDRLVDSVSVDAIRTLVPATAGTRVRLYSVGTRSLPAVKAFVQGEYYFRRFAVDSAVASFQRAVAIDTAFTLALHRLYAAFGWGQSANPTALDYLTRITAVSHGLSPRDSLLGLGVWTRMRSDGGVDHPAFFTRSRRRLTVLEEAARRYPEDPEVWYQLGEALFHSSFVVGASADETRTAFDRAIALDSGFAPAYIHAVELALNDNDAAAARRYVRAYLRIPSAHAERAGMQLLGIVLDSRRGRAEDLDRALAAASPGALHRLADAVHMWPDAQETQLEVWPRALAAAGVRRGPGDASTYGWPPPQASALATLFIFRGHLKEARQLIGDQFGAPFMQLAELGAIPPANVADAFDAWVRRPEPDTLLYPQLLGATAYHVLSLPCFVSMDAALWWASRRDTARLQRLAERENVARAIERRVRVRRFSLFETASAPVPLYTGSVRTDSLIDGDIAVRHPIGDFVHAATTLARGDTLGALDRFLAFPDSLCPDAPRLRDIRFRLLAAAGRDREAAAVFDRSTDRWIPLVLARARLAERVGDRPTSVKWYQFVADAWRHADPELQPLVAEARAAIARLGAVRGR